MMKIKFLIFYLKGAIKLWVVLRTPKVLDHIKKTYFILKKVAFSHNYFFKVEIGAWLWLALIKFAVCSS